MEVGGQTKKGSAAAQLTLIHRVIGKAPNGSAKIIPERLARMHRLRRKSNRQDGIAPGGSGLKNHSGDLETEHHSHNASNTDL
eukprot:432010-Amphidinium_carterae.2